MTISPHVLFLSLPRILHQYLTGYWPYEDQNLSVLRREMFTAMRAQNPGQPDYIHHTRLRAARNDVSVEPRDYLESPSFREILPDNFTIGHRLQYAIQALTEEYLAIYHHRLYIRPAVFAPWQFLLGQISPLVLIVAALYLHCQQKPGMTEEFIYRTLRYSSLPGCLEPELDEMIRGGEYLENVFFQPGLDDLHIHLNGTTEATKVWLHCLKRPKHTFNQLATQWNKSFVRQFYHERGIFTPYKLYCYLVLADWLRCWIIEMMLLTPYFQSNPSIITNKKVLSLHQFRLGLSLTADQSPPFMWREIVIHPLFKKKFILKLPDDAQPLQLEGIFLLYALDALFQSSNPILPIMLHCYLLIQNFFIQLTVQQQEQIGFEQFQHITDNTLREDVEKSYCDRFYQLHGMYGPDLAYVEGRFSPPKTPKKCINLINYIYNGYKKNDKFLKEEAQFNSKNYRPFSLFLVAHFIKKPDPYQYSNKGYCRHHRLRMDIFLRGRALLRARDLSELVKKSLVGIDAAANEMHAPPEVFAPLYRLFRSRGMTHFTYHAGEDFLHLVSGIRTIAEAILYLDLQPGDRLGHCTALGIDPEIWLRAIGQKCYCHRGEWLDNLVWMTHILRGNSEFGTEYVHFRQQIEDIYAKIYPIGKMPSCKILFEAWKIRDMDPLVGLYSRYTNIMDLFSSQYQIESNRCKYYHLHFPDAYAEFKRYHDATYRKSYDEIIPIDTSYTSSKLLSFLQDHIINKVNKKELIIEALPTSNVYISFYQKYEEHHLFRWMEKMPERPVPHNLCLGTDDPGIFSTNMRNEMTHILHVLRSKNLGGSALMGTLRTLVRHGRAARFARDKSILSGDESEDRPQTASPFGRNKFPPSKPSDGPNLAGNTVRQKKD